MEKWIPSKKQQSGSISRSFEFINGELTVLQEELHCPDEFIFDFIEMIKNRWSPDSCHSKARSHKRNNPSAY